MIKLDREKLSEAAGEHCESNSRFPISRYDFIAGADWAAKHGARKITWKDISIETKIALVVISAINFIVPLLYHFLK